MDFDLKKVLHHVSEDLTRYIKEAAESVGLVTTDFVGGRLRWRILLHGRLLAIYDGNTSAEVEKVCESLVAAVNRQMEYTSITMNALTVEPYLEINYNHMTTGCALSTPPDNEETQDVPDAD